MSIPNPITRRKALALGAGAAATAAGGGAALAVTPDATDAELLALCDEWWRIYRDTDAKVKTANDVEGRVREQFRAPEHLTRRVTLDNGRSYVIRAHIGEIESEHQQELLDLNAARDAALKASGRDDMEREIGKGWDRLSEVEERIISTPAQSFAGLAVKLHVAVFWKLPVDEDSDLSDRAVAAASADLERLAGRAGS